MFIKLPSGMILNASAIVSADLRLVDAAKLVYDVTTITGVITLSGKDKTALYDFLEGQSEYIGEDEE